MILLTSKGMLRIPSLLVFLECPVGLKQCAGFSAVAGWGRKPSGYRAQQIALQHGVPCLLLEDGFLRSVGLGNQDPPLSLVIDEAGIYYDGTRHSRLESLIGRRLSQDESERSTRLLDSWRASRVSKYNHLREYQRDLPSRYVLVVDQTFGDASVRDGLANPEKFQLMLQSALGENPGCIVLLKIHPDVFAGKKRGYFDVAEVSKIPRVKVLAEDVHPARLIEHADAVYAVTSQMGFEGLLWGKRVRTFGMPFYAGWGLTEDELPAPDRRKAVPLENLVHAALVEYPRYIDPETGNRCEVERVLAWMALQRRMRERFPATVYAVGFSRWKKSIVRDFFQGSTVKFVRNTRGVPAGATLAVWGRKAVAGGIPEGVAILRLEDGFLRSVGLGADLVRPLSWVMDLHGIYYDATGPSDLESLLQQYPFDDILIDRARKLREMIVHYGLTKYNVGAGEWRRPADQRRVILVPGQVENDASIQYGAAEIRTNVGLLQAVRNANPDAYVVYKPHPDVRAGLRADGAGESEAAAWCDEIVGDVPMQTMLDAVDELHLLTSLAGFEALLRGRKVVCYGRPFYSGWGLTTDMAPLTRRTRQLNLDELVAGVLILYPTYVSRTTGRFTTPERALEELLAWRSQSPTRVPLWRKGLRRIFRLFKG